MSRLARTPSGNTYGIVGADRRYRMQAEYAQACLEQRIYRYAQC